ncbi:MAG: bacteriocin [Lachnospiraceae bacterium]|nr:bacteriocin [Lachnospiraceae bacterium]
MAIAGVPYIEAWHNVPDTRHKAPGIQHQAYDFASHRRGKLRTIDEREEDIMEENRKQLTDDELDEISGG